MALQVISDYDPVLVAVISALTSALIVVAKTAYTSMRDERDFLRAEVLAALTAIVQRGSEVTRQRDEMVGDINNKLDSLRRLIVRKNNGENPK